MSSFRPFMVHFPEDPPGSGRLVIAQCERSFLVTEAATGAGRWFSFEDPGAPTITRSFFSHDEGWAPIFTGEFAPPDNPTPENVNHSH